MNSCEPDIVSLSRSKRDGPPSDEYMMAICDVFKKHNIRFLLLHPAISPHSRLHQFFSDEDASRLLWITFINTSELFASSRLTHAILGKFTIFFPAEPVPMLTRHA